MMMRTTTMMELIFYAEFRDELYCVCVCAIAERFSPKLCNLRIVLFIP